MGFEAVEVDSFSERVPGASGHASEFLQAVLETVRTEGVPVSLQMSTQRKGRTILEAKKLRFGAFMSKSRPMRLEVYADPTGRSLNVGWQLTAATLKGFMAEGGANPAIEAWRDRKDSSPQVRRELEAMLAEFHEGAFLPVLSRFVASAGATPDQAHA